MRNRYISSTSEQALARIDLNLLISLSVLLKEKNVSKAAETMFLTQSAMSKTLQRLRNLFDDELLYRNANSMVCTVKAKELEQQLPNLLDTLMGMMKTEEFDPLTCTDTFTLSIPASMDHYLLLPLIEILRVAAPKIKIIEYPARVDPYKMLEHSDIDFAIHIAKSDDANFIITPCGSFSLSVFAHKNHPLCQQTKVNFKDCLQYDFVAMNHGIDPNTKISSPVHSVFADTNYQEKVILKTSQLIIITEFLSKTDALYIGPNLVMSSTESTRDLVPVFQFDQSSDHNNQANDKNNQLDLYLIEHKRVSNSPAHKWLKEKILQLN